MESESAGRGVSPRVVLNELQALRCGEDGKAKGLAALTKYVKSQRFEKAQTISLVCHTFSDGRLNFIIFFIQLPPPVPVAMMPVTEQPTRSEIEVPEKKRKAPPINPRKRLKKIKS